MSAEPVLSDREKLLAFAQAIRELAVPEVKDSGAYLIVNAVAYSLQRSAHMVDIAIGSLK